MMEKFLQFDRDIFLFLNNLGSPKLDPLMKMISGFVVWIPLVIILLYLVFRNFSKRNILFFLLFFAIAIAVSDQLANIFKYGIMRLRPCYDPELVGKMRAVDCGGNFGFYSAHASTTFLIATYFFRILKSKARYIFLLFFWAAFVAFSRIYLGVHYPFDIFFGAMVGFLLGGFFSELFLKVLHKNIKQLL